MLGLSTDGYSEDGAGAEPGLGRPVRAPQDGSVGRAGPSDGRQGCSQPGPVPLLEEMATPQTQSRENAWPESLPRFQRNREAAL